MRCLRIAAIVILLAAIVPAQGALDRSRWKASRPIALPEIAAPELVYLPLDLDAVTVDSLAEYRIISEDDAEIPYRMIVEQGETETRVLENRILSIGRFDDKEAEIILDLGDESEFVKTIDLSLKGDDFSCLTAVFGSDDKKNWIDLNAPIQSGDRLIGRHTKGAWGSHWGDPHRVYRHEKNIEATSVPVPPHIDRYIRITLTPAMGELPEIEGATAIYTFTTPSSLVQVPAQMTRTEDAQENITLLDFDFGVRVNDLTRARLDIAEPAFDRVARIYGQGYEDELELDTSLQLHRLGPARDAFLKLEVEPTAKLRIAIRNGDDAPLTINSVKILRVQRGLIFPADPAKKYHLLYGRSDADWPDYEIARLPLAQPLSDIPRASLAEGRKLHRPALSLPAWTERQPALLWAVLAAVVALLLVLVVRAMRAAKQDGEAK